MRIKVLKRNPAGEVTYEYDGVLMERNERSITLEALFDRKDTPFQDVVFKTGDRFIEYYFSDRWYNIFEIRDRDNGQTKGWYCNVGMPAVIEIDSVSYVDLALDLWVSADWIQTVLDEDEFNELDINNELREGALKGLRDVQQLFSKKNPPL